MANDPWFDEQVKKQQAWGEQQRKNAGLPPTGQQSMVPNPSGVYPLKDGVGANGGLEVSMPNWADPEKSAFQGDFNAPGFAEDFFSKNGGGFTQPSQSEGFWAGISGKAQNPDPNTNFARDAYQQFQGSTPADMSPYYDHAVQQTSSGVNDQLAARGMFGSTQGVNMLGNAIGGVRAQQAKDEAGYGLQRAGLAGDLAQSADQSGRSNQNNELAWLTGMGGLAGSADQSRLGGLSMGMTGALGAQGAQRQRGQDFFGNQMDMGNALSGIIGQQYNQASDSDLALMDQWLQAQMGYPREAANQVSGDRAASVDEAGSIMGMITGGMGGKP